MRRKRTRRMDVILNFFRGILLYYCSAKLTDADRNAANSKTVNANSSHYNYEPYEIKTPKQTNNRWRGTGERLKQLKDTAVVDVARFGFRGKKCYKIDINNQICYFFH